MDTEALPGSRGRQMMMKKLRLYLWWKGKLSQRKQDGKTSFAGTSKDNFDKYGDLGEISKALQKKDKEKAEKAKCRRRVRGGAPTGSSSSSRPDNTSSPKPEPKDVNLDEIQNEADRFAQL